MAFIVRRVLVSLLIPFAWKQWRQRSKGGRPSTSSTPNP